MQETQPQTVSERTAWTSYDVWDAPTRILHWLTALLVLSGFALGFLLEYQEDLEFSLSTKLKLATVHSLLGCTLIATFIARIVWGFRGNRFARLHSLVPRWATLSAARDEAKQLLSPGGGVPRLGHGPLGRLSATALFATLAVLLASGLFRANSDLYFPPFGHMFAEYKAKAGVDPDTLEPSDMDSHDPAKLRKVWRYSVPIGLAHRVAAWLMLGLVFAHVAGVVLKELRQGGAVMSSMVGGRKLFRADRHVRVDE